MKKRGIALVGRADTAREQLSKYLRDGGFAVSECDALATPSRVRGAVLIDDPAVAADNARATVRAWLELSPARRAVVVTPRPAIWKDLALARGEHLFVLAAPAFGWQIVDALRAPVAAAPRRP